MYLWKRILSVAAAALMSAYLIGYGAMLPPGVVPPVSTVLAVMLIPVVVVGGSAVMRIRRRHLARAHAGLQTAPGAVRMDAPSR